jgi:hypothetical protein
VAVLLRALVLLEVWDSPVLYLHHWTETDNAFYDLWARQIVAGDLLSVRDVRPFHSWHGHVARAAYEASGGRGPISEATVRRIWDEWLGPARSIRTRSTLFHRRALGLSGATCVSCSSRKRCWGF